MLNADRVAELVDALENFREAGSLLSKSTNPVRSEALLRGLAERLSSLLLDSAEELITLAQKEVSCS